MTLAAATIHSNEHRAYLPLEQEAHHYTSPWYRAVMNQLSGPPFIPVSADVLNRSFPGGFRPKRREYKELEAKLQELKKVLQDLQEKVANGEELSEDEQAAKIKTELDIKKTKDKMEDKAEWFKNKKRLPTSSPGSAGGYNPNADLDCTPPATDAGDEDDRE